MGTIRCLINIGFSKYELYDIYMLERERKEQLGGRPTTQTGRMTRWCVLCWNKISTLMPDEYQQDIILWKGIRHELRCPEHNIERNSET